MRGSSDWGGGVIFSKSFSVFCLLLRCFQKGFFGYVSVFFIRRQVRREEVLGVGMGGKYFFYFTFFSVSFGDGGRVCVSFCEVEIFLVFIRFRLCLQFREEMKFIGGVLGVQKSEVMDRGVEVVKRGVLQLVLQITGFVGFFYVEGITVGVVFVGQQGVLFIVCVS